MQKKYEVIRLVKQDTSCHIIMDYVQGEILAEYLKRHTRVKKERLFLWIKQIIRQLGDLRMAKNAALYRYVTPFSIVVKRNGDLAMLDCHAKSNQHIVALIRKKHIWNCFFRADADDDDMYAFGKTIQFLLAKSTPIPKLTASEEKRLKKIISKCLSGNSRKQYQKFTEVLLDFSKLEKDEKQEKEKISKGRKICIVLAVLVVGIGVYRNLSGENGALFAKGKNENGKHQSARTDGKNRNHEGNQIEEIGEDVSFLDVGLTYFLELEDYRKSYEMFAKEENNKELAKQYQEVIAYMLGETSQTEEELEEVVRSIEEKTKQESDAKYIRSILKIYNKLDTSYARQRCIELGEAVLEEEKWKEADIERKVEIEIRKMLAEVYEKIGEKEKALQEYERLNAWIHSEDLYIEMLRIAENETKFLELCEKGIQDNPKSKELRIQYLKKQCKSPSVTKETCEASVKKMLKEYPALEKDFEFQKLCSECGIKIEGEQVWVEK